MNAITIYIIIESVLGISGEVIALSRTDLIKENDNSHAEVLGPFINSLAESCLYAIFGSKLFWSNPTPN